MNLIDSTNHIHKKILNERISMYGIDTITDEELVHVVTGVAVTKIRTNIEKYGLLEMVNFIDSFDLTVIQRRKLLLLYDFSKRIAQTPYRDKVILDSSSKAGEFFVTQLKFLSSEVFLMALLDAQNRLITTEVVSKGTVNEAPIYPREIVKTALLRNANSVILGHNHPGGSLNPSSPDIETTKRIVSALSSVNIKVIDHVIASEDRYISFAEKGLL